MATSPLLDLPIDVYRYNDGVRDVFTLHWHGLAYMVGFALALLLLRRFSAQGQLAIKPRELSEFVIFGALFGVLLGSRLGYALLYDWPRISKDLSLLLKLEVSSASFYGGLLGLAVYAGSYARRKQVSFLNLTDHLAVAAPLGLLLGRLADFMTGEVLGRITSVRWAMLFPLEVHLPSFVPAQPSDMTVKTLPDTHGAILELAHNHPDLREALVRILNPRHPWPLYAALLEGLVLFCVLYGLRQRARSLSDGVLTGVFLLGYAGVRLGCDFLREPTLGDPMRLGLTVEQWLCLPMLVCGAGLMVWSRAAARRPVPAPATP